MSDPEGNSFVFPRVDVDHFSLSPPRLTFLAWGDFHARSRFAPTIIPKEKWGLLVV